MRNYLLMIIVSVLLCGMGCSGNKVTKTLYGTWDPILESTDPAKGWEQSSENYLINVSGKCEAIEVTKTEKGDLANPDVPMADAKCFGNRDQLSFTDTIFLPHVYDLKLDASKDTLIGTITIVRDGVPDSSFLRIKFLRVGAE